MWGLWFGCDFGGTVQNFVIVEGLCGDVVDYGSCGGHSVVIVVSGGSRTERVIMW